MAKESKEERKAARKAEKKGTKEKLVEESGVKKSKSDKKEKKEKRKVLAEKVLNEVEGKKLKKEESDDEDEDEKPSDVEVEKAETLSSRPVGALVPFANPLADDKVAKKVFKSVKKAAAQRTLKRGVKEVVKALRKSPAGSASDSSPIGVVILAADISPMDVISHIPVLAEDHSIPYIYVTSRAELGMAGQTKRPTSVVMVSRDQGKKKGEAGSAEKDDGESWDETYKSLVKVVQKEGVRVKV